MTNISNSFAYDFCQLPSKYTISTLQSVDIADNQHSYGRILKFSRFNQRQITCLQVVCNMSFVILSVSFKLFRWFNTIAKLAIIFDLTKRKRQNLTKNLQTAKFLTDFLSA